MKYFVKKPGESEPFEVSPSALQYGFERGWIGSAWTVRDESDSGCDWITVEEMYARVQGCSVTMARLRGAFVFAPRRWWVRALDCLLHGQADDNFDLDKAYEDAKRLFLRAEHDRAFDTFERIYMVDCTFRNVAIIVHDYYDTEKAQWIAKYEAQFRP